MAGPRERVIRGVLAVVLWAFALTSFDLPALAISAGLAASFVTYSVFTGKWPMAAPACAAPVMAPSDDLEDR
ncbi:MAG: hypothetical protein L0G23_03510 [Ruaniaceae bacterium]|nr:hypothetical protein [Ruaniaceae bacterium]